MLADIKRARDAAEFYSGENCFILEIANDATDPAVSVARARVAPGMATEWHRLEGIDERYVIVSGTGNVEVGNGAPTRVGPGDVVRIPADVPQRITNIGQEDLVFYCICTPRFVQRAYVPLPGWRTASAPD